MRGQETPQELRQMFSELDDLTDTQIEVLRAFCLGCDSGRISSKRTCEIVLEAFGIRITRRCAMHLYSPAFNKLGWWRELSFE